MPVDTGFLYKKVPLPAKVYWWILAISYLICGKHSCCILSKALTRPYSNLFTRSNLKLVKSGPSCLVINDYSEYFSLGKADIDAKESIVIGKKLKDERPLHYDMHPDTKRN